jgi:chitodextrinase
MKRNGFGLLLVASFLLLVATVPARAHHSFAAVFDASQPVTVQGVITEVRLENPHCWFFINVRDASGKVEKWSFEASTPTSLIRSGVKPGFIKAGDEVTIKGWHARDASQNAGAAREIVVADGRAFAVGPAVGPGGR